MRKLSLVLAAFCLLVTQVAVSSSFQQVDLAYGISLEVPRHWNVISINEKKNTQASVEAMAENAGLPTNTHSLKEHILVMADPTSPTGALLRISVALPGDYSQEDLAHVTKPMIEEMKEQMLQASKQAEGEGGIKIDRFEGFDVIKHNGRKVLFYDIRRESTSSGDFWRESRHLIPVEHGVFEIAFSYNEYEAIIWEPILKKVVNSITFDTYP